MSAFGDKADIYRVRLGQQERGLRQPVLLYCVIAVLLGGGTQSQSTCASK